MAIAFGSAGTRLLVSTASTSWAVPYPSGIAADDLLVLHIVTNGGAVTSTSLTSAGWTEVFHATLTNPKGGVWIKKATGSESGTLSVTTASTTGNAMMFHYSGVDTTTPLDVAAVTVEDSTGSDTATTLASVTTTHANTLLIYANGANSGSTTMTGPGTERVDHGSLGGTNAKAGALYDEAVSATGATGTRTITLSAARTDWGVMFALRPAVVATPNHYLETWDDGASLGIWSASTGGSGTVSNFTTDNFQSIYGVGADVPAATVDKAGLVTTFTGVQQASIEGWWKVTTEGASSSSNVPFARIFSGSQRLADVYRQNQQGAGNNIWLRVVKAAGGSNYWFINANYALPLDTWVYIKFTWGLDGNPYLSINGTKLLDSADKPTDWYAASSIDTAYLGTHEAGNQGAWSMDAVTLSTYPTATTPVIANGAYGQFSGSGTLTASVVAGASASASLSGSGTLTKSVTPAFPITAALSGSGTLTDSLDSMTVTKSVPLSGSGTLSKAVVAGFTASMSSSSTGTLTASVVGMSGQASASFTGSGTLSVSSGSGARATIFGTGSPGTTATNSDVNPVNLATAFKVASGTGWTATGTRVWLDSDSVATLTGHMGYLLDSSFTQLASVSFGTMTLGGWTEATFSTPIALTAGATYWIAHYFPDGRYSALPHLFDNSVTSADDPLLTALDADTFSPGNGIFNYGSAGDWSGQASFNNTFYGVDVVTQSPGGSGVVPAITKSVALSGSGTLSSTRTPAVSITSNLSGVGDLTYTASNSYTRTAALSGSGTLTGAITGMSLTRSVALSGSGTLSTGTVNNKTVSANLSGSGAFVPYLTAVGFTVAAPLSGSGTLSGTSVVNRTANPQLSGSGTLTAVVKPNLFKTFTGASDGVLSALVTCGMAVTAELVGVGSLVGGTNDEKNYDVKAYLAEKRWSGGLGSQRWKGSL